MNLGAKIRTSRLRAGLRLRDVAERCGFTKSLLSKIETGAAKPPIATLSAIAKALRVPMASLLDEQAGARTALSLAGASRVEAMEATDKGYLFSLLAGARVDKCMQPFVFHAKRGEVRPSPLRHAGEEFVFVINGTLSFRVGPVRYELSAGDSLYFDSEEDHDMQPSSAAATWLAVFCEQARALRAGNAPAVRPAKSPVTKLPAKSKATSTKEKR